MGLTERRRQGIINRLVKITVRNRVDAHSGLADRLDEPAEPAMGRLVLESPMPEHAQDQGRRWAGQFADAQIMVAREGFGDAAAENGDEIRLR
jgi:hypothetical protein